MYCVYRISGDKFQSTHPLRGATEQFFITAAREMVFQSTHPLRGATVHRFGITCNEVFQSTHPLRGATRTINA